MFAYDFEMLPEACVHEACEPGDLVHMTVMPQGEGHEALFLVGEGYDGFHCIGSISEVAFVLQNYPDASEELNRRAVRASLGLHDAWTDRLAPMLASVLPF